jgi:hypothetical protein
MGLIRLVGSTLVTQTQFNWMGSIRLVGSALETQTWFELNGLNGLDSISGLSIGELGSISVFCTHFGFCAYDQSYPLPMVWYNTLKYAISFCIPDKLILRSTLHFDADVT